jgi:hypothetical protein
VLLPLIVGTARFVWVTVKAVEFAVQPPADVTRTA